MLYKCTTLFLMLVFVKTWLCSRSVTIQNGTPSTMKKMRYEQFLLRMVFVTFIELANLVFEALMNYWFLLEDSELQVVWCGFTSFTWRKPFFCWKFLERKHERKQRDSFLRWLSYWKLLQLSCRVLWIVLLGEKETRWTLQWTFCILFLLVSFFF